MSVINYKWLQLKNIPAHILSFKNINPTNKNTNNRHSFDIQIGLENKWKINFLQRKMECLTLILNELLLLLSLFYQRKISLPFNKANKDSNSRAKKLPYSFVFTFRWKIIRIFIKIQKLADENIAHAKIKFHFHFHLDSFTRFFLVANWKSFIFIIWQLIKISDLHWIC